MKDSSTIVVSLSISLGILFSIFEGKTIYIVGYTILGTIAFMSIILFYALVSFQERKSYEDHVTVLSEKLGISENDERFSVKKTFKRKDMEI